MSSAQNILFSAKQEITPPPPPPLSSSLYVLADRGENASKSRGEGTNPTGGGKRGEETGRAEGAHPERVRGRAGEEETKGNGGEEANI